MNAWPKTSRPGNGDDYRRILNALYELAGRGAAVDLGCGEAHTTKDWPMCLLVDLVYRKAVLAAGRTLDQMDMRLAPALFRQERRAFNFALMSDSLEHLKKEDGTKLIAEMIPLAKVVAIFVPVGPWKVDVAAIDPDAHKSEWWPREFQEQGWGVWEFPSYHRFGAETLGAFWAWKFREAQPTAEQVSEKSGVAI